MHCHVASGSSTLETIRMKTAENLKLPEKSLTLQTSVRVSVNPWAHTLRTTDLAGVPLCDSPITPQVQPPSLLRPSLASFCPAPHRIRSSSLLVFLLILAAAFWLFQLLRSVCNLFSYWDIQVFYREALHIPPVSWAGTSVEGCWVRGRGRWGSGGCTDGRTHWKVGRRPP